MIIGQTILHFGISKEYEKYMKMVISFMVAAQIVFSFGAYFGKESQNNMKWDTEEYYKNWNKNMEKMTEMLEERQENIGNTIEERIEEEQAKVQEQEKENNIEIKEIKIE